MNYEQMSDFEINKLVAEALGFTVTQECPSEVIGYMWVIRKNKGEWEGLPDYCNDPSAAWPIIIENKIGKDCLDSLNLRVAESGIGYQIASGNPLRAAMIVYLMMQEAR